MPPGSCRLNRRGRRRLRRRLVAADQLRRHALRNTWHAVGEYRLAFAGQRFLGVEPVFRIEIFAAAERKAERQSNHREQRPRAAHRIHQLLPEAVIAISI